MIQHLNRAGQEAALSDLENAHRQPAGQLQASVPCSIQRALFSLQKSTANFGGLEAEHSCPRKCVPCDTSEGSAETKAAPPSSAAVQRCHFVSRRLSDTAHPEPASSTRCNTLTISQFILCGQPYCNISSFLPSLKTNHIYFHIILL